MKRGLFAIILALLSPRVLAQPAEEELFSGRTAMRLAEIGISTVPDRGEALVAFSSGGAAGKVVIVLQPGRQAPNLKSDLDRVLADLDQDGLRVHSSGALIGEWSQSQLWLRESQVVLPLPRLAEALKGHGMRPLFIVKARPEVGLNQDLRPLPEGKTWGYYIIRDPKIELVLSSKITNWDLTAAVFFFVWPCGVIASAFMAAGRVARQTHISATRRIRAHNLILMSSILIAIGPHALFAFFYMTSGRLNLFSDLWLGGAPLQPLAFLLFIIPLGSVSLAGRRLTKIEKEMLGPNPEFSVLAEAKLTSFQSVIRKQKAVQAALIGLVVIPASLMLVHGLTTGSDYWAMAGLGLMILHLLFGRENLPSVIDPRFKAEISELQEAQMASDRLAGKLGVRAPRIVPEVRVRFAQAHVPVKEGRNLAVNPSFAVSFSPEEQEHWIAWALVTETKGSYDTTRFLLTGGFGILMGVVAFVALSPIGQWPLLLIFAVLPLGAYLMMKERGKRLAGSEVEAALLTGNISAALSAERKLWMLNGPSDEDSESALKKRLEEIKTGFMHRSGQAAGGA